MDISWHRDHTALPGLEEYDRMCRLKTGCLARLAAVLGVQCGLCDDDRPRGVAVAGVEEAAALFGDAAEKLGVGFQILDDVKNLTTGVPGKTRGDDVVEGKKSLPVLLYLHSHPERRAFASRCFAAAAAGGTAAPEVEALIAALDGAGAIEAARSRGLELIRESKACFSAESAAGFPLSGEGRELLGGLIESIT
jgi:octaprenyl-diphosphate synthase